MPNEPSQTPIDAAVLTAAISVVDKWQRENPEQVIGIRVVIVCPEHGEVICIKVRCVRCQRTFAPERFMVPEQRSGSGELVREDLRICECGFAHLRACCSVCEATQ